MNRRAVVLVAAGVIGVAAYGMPKLIGRVSHAAAEMTFPAAGDSANDRAPASAEFAGAAQCASCHAAQFAVWRRSTHGRAGGTPGSAAMVAPFDGRRMRFRDATVTPSRIGDRLTFTVAVAGRPVERFEVAGVIGGAHMRGGGTQGFVSRFPDGTLRFLPFDFAKREGTWFCNTLPRGGNGWIPITPALPIAACGDWTPNRILGDDANIANCSGCHGSRVEVRFDTAAKRYATTVGSFTIDCESCHGPGLEHIERVRGGSADIAMRSLSLLPKAPSVGTCMACHAVKSTLRPGYRPGASLARFYSVALAQLGDSPLHPDGRVRTFAYQEGHLSSDCFVNGGMTCTDCHDPHSQRYRDVRGTPLASPLDDRQCTGCHVSKGVDPLAHTKHRTGSRGSACVACHMPYLQQPELGSRIRYARSDHTIPIPRPRTDSAQGILGACAGCHTDRSIETLERDVGRFWGALKPRPPVVDAITRIERLGSRADAARALITRAPAPMAGRLAGFGLFLERYLTLDMPQLEPDVEDRLLRLADEADPDIRALGLAALHYARGTNSRIRTELARRLSTAGASDAMLRRRWVLVLGYLGDKSRDAGDMRTAAGIYRRALEVEPTNPQLLLSLGVALAGAGDVSGAVEQYQRSLAASPAQPLVFLNLGLALEASDAMAAANAYRNAIAINPYEAVAYFNLANVFLRQQRPADAIPLYEQAVRLDPSLANANFYLARAYALTNQVDRAIAAMDQGLQFKPDSAAQELRAELVRIRGRR